MRTGVGYPSYGQEAVWTAAVQTWEINYPVSNLADLIRTTAVGRMGGTAQREVSCILPVARTIQLVALVGHNITSATAAFRVYAFSDNNPDPVGNAGHIVADSGVQLVWPTGSAPVAGYRSIRPYIFSAAVSARSLYIAINPVDVAADLEAIEIAAFWEWPGVSYGRGLGFNPSDQLYEVAGGAGAADEGFAPMAVSGQIDYLALGSAIDTAMDFQNAADQVQPFVWMQDYDTPASWPRTCIFAKNDSIPASVGAVYRHDKFQFSFQEYRR